MIYLNLLLLFSGTNAYATTDTKQDTALFQVAYRMIHIEDSTRKNDPVISEMILYMGTDESLFRMLADEESMLLLHISKGGTEATFNLNEACSSQITSNGKSIQTERIVDNMYQIVEETPQIQWQLTDETKHIDQYRVQKAIGKFRGRTYRVWFSPDIPLPYGPWKLNGLPGLILEAKDERAEIIFEFGGIERLNKHVRIEQPKSFKIKLLNLNEYQKIYRRFRKDPIAFMQGSLGVSRNQINTNEDRSAAQFNNPLEKEI
ncbi:GLPGLI family protein [Sphingobacterium sp. DK4209]|uniref:GLPGLI family protein n=1 Tax=Sphingobacterium zhuxiongii TaxID=2662364 RepID=A0A5Q0QCM7_9SPHI|nr:MULTISPECIES: GLPGLI family protein [unclassified Sphingobacterium]MVZ66951.1 GLPGLI family protein [Sphingobacterium sp. DK4209]QGA26631.1 GLPGLI family protein [Sphingobacterium sp. dk4302]